MRVLSNAQIREVENETARSGPGFAGMMADAGHACAEHIVSEYPDAYRIVFLCGSGRNGGDAYACACDGLLGSRSISLIRLSRKPYDEVSSFFRAKALKKSNCTELFFDRDETARLLAESDLIADAVFGIGFRGVLSGDELDAVRLANSSGKPVFAIDVPSGVGENATGAEKVRADSTLTMIAVKRSMTEKPASRACGNVFVAHIGETS
ncbi:MAG: NAD(P)H-hydrate epimerase, partial [Clostridia bacterium]|nr:NAD(P)H-hydrate epimerase [Clostridia bacterium]